MPSDPMTNLQAWSEAKITFACKCGRTEEMGVRDKKENYGTHTERAFASLKQTILNKIRWYQRERERGTPEYIFLFSYL